MKRLIKNSILYLILIMSFLCGCSNGETTSACTTPTNSNDEAENTTLPMMISYGVIFVSDSGKTLKEENPEELSVLIYSRFEDAADYYIFDFDRQLFFNTDFGQTVNSEQAIRPADNEIKQSIISELEKFHAEDWWGKSYDVKSEEIQTWFNSTDYSHIWRLYMQFNNGEVITLYGIGYDNAEYAPEELDEFLKYLRSFVISDKSL